MKKIDRRKVRNITEQTTREALNEQQLNEAGLVKGLGKVAGKIPGWLGFGAKRTANVANKALGRTVDAAGKWGNAMQSGLRSPEAIRAGENFMNSAMRADKWATKAQMLARNSARAKGLGMGLLGGALGTYALANAGGPKQPTPDPNLMPPGSMQGGAPYPGHSGGGYDPYADYYGGGHSGGGYNPYADYYGGAYSGGGYDPAMMMYLMNQSSGTGGTSGGTDPMMLYLLSGYGY